MAINVPLAAHRNNDSTLVYWLIGGAALAVASLVIGGYWMHSHNQQASLHQQHTQQYRTYLRNTLDTAATVPSTPSPAIVQARETREYLLKHPAVTPGEGFNQPGVQSTGKAIAQALDRAHSAQQPAK